MDFLQVFSRLAQDTSLDLDDRLDYYELLFDSGEKDINNLNQCMEHPDFPSLAMDLYGVVLADISSHRAALIVAALKTLGLLLASKPFVSGIKSNPNLVLEQLCRLLSFGTISVVSYACWVISYERLSGIICWKEFAFRFVEGIAGALDRYGLNEECLLFHSLKALNRINKVYPACTIQLANFWVTSSLSGCLHSDESIATEGMELVSSVSKSSSRDTSVIVESVNWIANSGLSLFQTRMDELTSGKPDIPQLERLTSIWGYFIILSGETLLSNHSELLKLWRSLYDLPSLRAPLVIQWTYFVDAILSHSDTPLRKSRLKFLMQPILTVIKSSKSNVSCRHECIDVWFKFALKASQLSEPGHHNRIFDSVISAFFCIIMESDNGKPCRALVLARLSDLLEQCPWLDAFVPLLSKWIPQYAHSASSFDTVELEAFCRFIGNVIQVSESSSNLDRKSGHSLLKVILSTIFEAGETNPNIRLATLIALLDSIKKYPCLQIMCIDGSNSRLLTTIVYKWLGLNSINLLEGFKVIANTMESVILNSSMQEQWKDMFTSLSKSKIVTLSSESMLECFVLLWNVAYSMNDRESCCQPLLDGVYRGIRQSSDRFQPILEQASLLHGFDHSRANVSKPSHANTYAIRPAKRRRSVHADFLSSSVASLESGIDTLRSSKYTPIEAGHLLSECMKLRELVLSAERLLIKSVPGQTIQYT